MEFTRNLVCIYVFSCSFSYLVIHEREKKRIMLIKTFTRW